MSHAPSHWTQKAPEEILRDMDELRRAASEESEVQVVTVVGDIPDAQLGRIRVELAGIRDGKSWVLHTLRLSGDPAQLQPKKGPQAMLLSVDEAALIPATALESLSRREDRLMSLRQERKAQWKREATSLNRWGRR